MPELLSNTILIHLEPNCLAEVRELDVVDLAVLVHADENVLQLDISVHDAAVVAIVKGMGNLKEDTLDLALLNFFIILTQVLTQVHVLRIGHNEEVVLLVVKVDELQHIRMIELMQNVNFLDELLDLERKELALLQYLDSDHHAELLVDRKFDVREVALADLLPEEVFGLDLAVIIEIRLQLSADLVVAFVLHPVARFFGRQTDLGALLDLGPDRYLVGEFLLVLTEILALVLLTYRIHYTNY